MDVLNMKTANRLVVGYLNVASKTHCLLGTAHPIPPLKTGRPGKPEGAASKAPLTSRLGRTRSSILKAGCEAGCGLFPSYLFCALYILVTSFMPSFTSLFICHFVPYRRLQ